MNRAAAVRRAAELSAEACSGVLAALSGRPGSFSALEVVEHPGDLLSTFDYPQIAVRIAFTEGITGENLFVISPAQARALAAAMMGAELPSAGEDEISELELSAVSEAMNQMMGAVASAMAVALAVPTDIAPPLTAVLHAPDELGQPFEAARFSAQFTLAAGDLEATIVQLVSQEFADMLSHLFGAGDTTREVLAERRTSVAAAADDTLSAVDRTARITADASAQVLSTLIAGEASATLPSVEAEPEDPLAALAYPLIVVEVLYVSGVNGSNLFVLSSDQAATLAAVMMGVDAPLGDGLSDLELSAVSEAMNQMMGSATNVLADTLSLDIEVAPPTCRVMGSVDEARQAFGEAAFCTRFRLVSDRLQADVVQLVPGDFAEHLRQAFAAADHGRAVVTAPVPPPPAPEPVRAAAGSIDAGSIGDVRVRVSAELGRARLPIARVTNLPPGAIVELDRAPTDTVDLLVNGRRYATARLVVVDGEYAVQIVSLTPDPVTA